MPKSYKIIFVNIIYQSFAKDCIKDIELAIKLGYPEKSRGKLYLRIVECYLKLNKKILAARIISELNNSSQYDMTNEQRGKYFTLYTYIYLN